MLIKLSDVHTYNFILDGYVRSRNVSELHSLHPILRMMYTSQIWCSKCAERQLCEIRYKRVIRTILVR
jgi:hypothetical protein